MRNIALGGALVLALGMPTAASVAEEGPPSPAAPKARSSGGVFAKYDENRDGALARKELPARLWKVLSRFDRNQDGSLTRQEMSLGSGPKPAPARHVGPRPPVPEKKQGTPQRPGFQGIQFELGDVVPDLSAYDVREEVLVPLRSLQGRHHVLLFGCLT